MKFKIGEENVRFDGYLMSIVFDRSKFEVNTVARFFKCSNEEELREILKAMLKEINYLLENLDFFTQKGGEVNESK